MPPLPTSNRKPAHQTVALPGSSERILSNTEVHNCSQALDSCDQSPGTSMDWPRKGHIPWEHPVCVRLQPRGETKAPAATILTSMRQVRDAGTIPMESFTARGSADGTARAPCTSLLRSRKDRTGQGQGSLGKRIPIHLPQRALCAGKDPKSSAWGWWLWLSRHTVKYKQRVVQEQTGTCHAHHERGQPRGKTKRDDKHSPCS